MPTIQEIKASYGEEMTRIINECFELSHKAQQVDVSMSSAVKDRLGPAEFNNVRAAEGEAFASAERDRLKERYLDLELEMRAAVEQRVNQVEEALSPKQASFADYAAASSVTAEQLVNAMDMAFEAGDEDAALVAFAAGRQRDLEQVVSHAIDVREDWNDLYAELVEAANEPELGPGDKFEMFAAQAPSKADILSAPQAGINVLPELR